MLYVKIITEHTYSFSCCHEQFNESVAQVTSVFLNDGSFSFDAGRECDKSVSVGLSFKVCLDANSLWSYLGENKVTYCYYLGFYFYNTFFIHMVLFKITIISFQLI